MTLPDEESKHDALEEFASLLADESTPESRWQNLFARRPCVLLDSLPVRLTNVYPEVALDSGRPDFIFSEAPTKPEFGHYGVIELKRPNDPILRVYSTAHIHPSAKLTQATHQVEAYLREMAESARIGKQRSLVLGGNRHAFIIIGTSDEVLKKCHTELQRQQLKHLLPRGVSVIPYDDLFERFRAGLGRAFIVEAVPSHNQNFREPDKFFLMCDEYDLFDYAVLKIMTSSRWIRVPRGDYRQVFGVPRQLWPLGQSKFQEYYDYEIRKLAGDERAETIFREAKESGTPLQATELRGEFLSDGGRWGRITMHLRTPGGETDEVDFDGWDFSFYEGDKPYRSDGTIHASAAWSE